MTHVYVLMLDSYEGGSLLAVSADLERVKVIAAERFAQELVAQKARDASRGYALFEITDTLTWEENPGYRGSILQGNMPISGDWLTICHVPLDTDLSTL